MIQILRQEDHMSMIWILRLDDTHTLIQILRLEGTPLIWKPIEGQWEKKGFVILLLVLASSAHPFLVGNPSRPTETPSFVGLSSY